MLLPVPPTRHPWWVRIRGRKHCIIGGKAVITWYLDPCSSIDATPPGSHLLPTATNYSTPFHLTPFTPPPNACEGASSMYSNNSPLPVANWFTKESISGHASVTKRWWIFGWISYKTWKFDEGMRFKIRYFWLKKMVHFGYLMLNFRDVKMYRCCFLFGDGRHVRVRI